MTYVLKAVSLNSVGTNKLWGCFTQITNCLWNETIYIVSIKPSPDRSAVIATGYGLDDRVIGVRFPAGAGNFSF